MRSQNTPAALPRHALSFSVPRRLCHSSTIFCWSEKNWATRSNALATVSKFARVTDASLSTGSEFQLNP